MNSYIANVLLALSHDSYNPSDAFSNKVFAIDANSGKPFEAISIPVIFILIWFDSIEVIGQLFYREWLVAMT